MRRPADHNNDPSGLHHCYQPIKDQRLNYSFYLQLLRFFKMNSTLGHGLLTRIKRFCTPDIATFCRAFSNCVAPSSFLLLSGGDSV